MKININFNLMVFYYEVSQFLAPWKMHHNFGNLFSNDLWVSEAKGKWNATGRSRKKSCRLKVEAVTHGINYAASFPLPYFHPEPCRVLVYSARRSFSPIILRRAIKSRIYVHLRLRIYMPKHFLMCSWRAHGSIGLGL